MKLGKNIEIDVIELSVIVFGIVAFVALICGK